MSCEDACCAPPAPPAGPARTELIRRAFRLEYLTLGWMTVEAAVALWSGRAAGSVALTAFGIDSVIELASAGVLFWRLSAELRGGVAVGERAERVASRTAGALLLALATYVVLAAAIKLAVGQGAAFSWPGLLVTLAAIPVMAVLARRKLALAEALGSRALRADAMESLTCGWLSIVVVIGLGAQALTGAWWVDAVTSLAVVWLVAREGQAAWRGEACCAAPQPSRSSRAASAAK